VSGCGICGSAMVHFKDPQGGPDREVCPNSGKHGEIQLAKSRGGKKAAGKPNPASKKNLEKANKALREKRGKR
jgi:hypothetical protein